MKFKDYIQEKKIEKNLSKVEGQKVKMVFYDDAGLVLITKDYQFDMNFLSGVDGSTTKLKGSELKSVKNINGDIHIIADKKGTEVKVIAKSPKEVLIT